MTKDTAELVTECWQLLVEYIPRRDHASAAEQLMSYLATVLDKTELVAVTDLDGDLADAHATLDDQEELEDEYDTYHGQDEE